MVHLNTALATTFLFASHDDKVIGYLRRKITLNDGKVVSDERVEQPVHMAHIAPAPQGGPA
jgi:putative ABC transport system ATP-binding protein